MTCDEFESRFLVGAEVGLSADERTAREQHLAECDACRTLVLQFDQLDAALTRQIKNPALSADFIRRLTQRIQAEAKLLSEAEHLERKRQLQLEYEAGLEKMRGASLRLIGLLEGLSYVGLAALAGGLAWQFTPRILNFLAPQGVSGADQNLFLAAMAGVIFLAVGLAVALRQTSRQQWLLR